LVSLRNIASEEQAQVSAGRLFHSRAAATGKARSPRVSRRVDGTCSVVVTAERRQRRATICDVGRRLSDSLSHRTAYIAEARNRLHIDAAAAAAATSVVTM